MCQTEGFRPVPIPLTRPSVTAPRNPSSSRSAPDQDDLRRPCRKREDLRPSSPRPFVSVRSVGVVSFNAVSLSSRARRTTCQPKKPLPRGTASRAAPSRSVPIRQILSICISKIVDARVARARPLRQRQPGSDDTDRHKWRRHKPKTMMLEAARTPSRRIGDS